MSVSLLKAPTATRYSVPGAVTHRVTYVHPAWPNGPLATCDIRVTAADVGAMAAIGMDAAEILGCARIADIHHVSADRAFSLYRSVAPLG